jgi:hypothetical protein
MGDATIQLPISAAEAILNLLFHVTPVISRGHVLFAQ